MIEKQCEICGKRMTFQFPSEVRKLCSVACHSEYKRRLYEKEYDGLPMKPLDANSISDDGFVALVKAIVHKAGNDVKHFAPGTPARVDAEEFFLSEYFAALTGLEGEPILRQLQEEYVQRKKRLHNRRNVK